MAIPGQKISTSVARKKTRPGSGERVGSGGPSTGTCVQRLPSKWHAAPCCEPGMKPTAQTSSGCGPHTAWGKNPRGKALVVQPRPFHCRKESLSASQRCEDDDPPARNRPGGSSWPAIVSGAKRSPFHRSSLATGVLAGVPEPPTQTASGPLPNRFQSHRIIGVTEQLESTNRHPSGIRSCRKAGCSPRGERRQSRSPARCWPTRR